MIALLYFSDFWIKSVFLSINFAFLNSFQFNVIYEQYL